MVYRAVPFLACSLYVRSICVLVLASTIYPMNKFTPKPAKQTESYITRDQLRRLASLANDSLQRNENSAATFMSSPVFRQETDVFFRALMGVNGSKNVLTSKKAYGHYLDSVASFSISTRNTEAFVSKVPPVASQIRDIVVEMTNNSAQPGDTYRWIGGTVVVFEVGASRVYGLFQECRNIFLFDQDGNPRGNPSFEFLLSEPPIKGTLLVMGERHGPILCGGSGLTFREHTKSSQRLWLSSTSDSGQNSIESVGPVTPSSLNSGNFIMTLSDDQLEQLERSQDEVLGVSISTNLNSGLGGIDEKYSQGFEQYNNMAFLTLSVAAILSSAAVAGVSLGPGYERNAIVAVEATVVYSFLVIMTHACVVFTRPNTFLVDIKIDRLGNFTYDGTIVQAHATTVFTAVGEPLHFPMLLLITEVFAILAAVVVTIILVCNCRQLSRRRRKNSMGTYPFELDEEYFLDTVS